MNQDMSQSGQGISGSESVVRRQLHWLCSCCVGQLDLIEWDLVNELNHFCPIAKGQFTDRLGTFGRECRRALEIIGRSGCCASVYSGWQSLLSEVENVEALAQGDFADEVRTEHDFVRQLQPLVRNLRKSLEACKKHIEQMASVTVESPLLHLRISPDTGSGQGPTSGSGQYPT